MKDVKAAYDKFVLKRKIREGLNNGLSLEDATAAAFPKPKVPAKADSSSDEDSDDDVEVVENPNPVAPTAEPVSPPRACARPMDATMIEPDGSVADAIASDNAQKDALEPPQ